MSILVNVATMDGVFTSMITTLRRMLHSSISLTPAIPMTGNISLCGSRTTRLNMLPPRSMAVTRSRQRPTFDGMENTLRWCITKMESAHIVSASPLLLTMPLRTTRAFGSGVISSHTMASQLASVICCMRMILALRISRSRTHLFRIKSQMRNPVLLRSTIIWMWDHREFHKLKMRIL